MVSASISISCCGASLTTVGPGTDLGSWQLAWPPVELPSFLLLSTTSCSLHTSHGCHQLGMSLCGTLCIHTRCRGMACIFFLSHKCKHSCKGNLVSGCVFISSPSVVQAGPGLLGLSGSPSACALQCWDCSLHSAPASSGTFNDLVHQYSGYLE